MKILKKVKRIESEVTSRASCHVHDKSIKFGTETVFFRGITCGEQDSINARWNISRLQNEISYYLEKKDDVNVPKEERHRYEGLFIDAMTDLCENAYESSKDVCRLVIDKPKDWFDTLTKQDWEWLWVEIAPGLMGMSLHELYFEAYQLAINEFKSKYRKKTMTGEDVAKIMEDIRKRMLNPNKKKDTTLSGASPGVGAIPANDARIS